MVLIKEISPSYGFIVGNVLGRPYAAPIFMFCMGVGIVYSRRSQWDIMVKRGITLFLLGILVNVFEFFLPYYVCGTLLGSWDIFPIAGGLLLFCVDILAFAGLSFILMGILKKFELSNKKFSINWFSKFNNSNSYVIIIYSLCNILQKIKNKTMRQTWD